MPYIFNGTDWVASLTQGGGAGVDDVELLPDNTIQFYSNGVVVGDPLALSLLTLGAIDGGTPSSAADFTINGGTP